MQELTLESASVHIINYICQYLTFSELGSIVSLSETCKNLNATVNNDELWKELFLQSPSAPQVQLNKSYFNEGTSWKTRLQYALRFCFTCGINEGEASFYCNMIQKNVKVCKLCKDKKFGYFGKKTPIAGNVSHQFGLFEQEIQTLNRHPYKSKYGHSVPLVLGIDCCILAKIIYPQFTLINDTDSGKTIEDAFAKRKEKYALKFFFESELKSVGIDFLDTFKEIYPQIYETHEIENHLKKFENLILEKKKIENYDPYREISAVIIQDILNQRKEEIRDIIKNENFEEESAKKEFEKYLNTGKPKVDTTIKKLRQNSLKRKEPPLRSKRISKYRKTE